MNIFKLLFNKKKFESYKSPCYEDTLRHARDMQNLEDMKMLHKAREQGFKRFQSLLEYKDTEAAKFWSKLTGIKDIDPIWINDLGLMTLEYYPAKSKYTSEDLNEIVNDTYQQLKQDYLCQKEQ